MELEDKKWDLAIILLFLTFVFGFLALIGLMI